MAHHDVELQSCETNSDCRTGNKCVGNGYLRFDQKGTCHKVCSNDGNCNAPLKCKNGACVEPCTSDYNTDEIAGDRTSGERCSTATNSVCKGYRGGNSKGHCVTNLQEQAGYEAIDQHQSKK